MTSLDLRPDDPVIARLTRAVGALDPDPLFRRRLRGEVLNRHVAVREGLPMTEPPRHMGRLGRGVLLASVALAATVGSVGAVSQQSLPGDALYPVKLQIEEIRLQVAPAWMRGGLELAALDARLDEVERLAEADRWSDVTAAVNAAVATRAQRTSSGDSVARQPLTEHTAVLEELLTEVPDSGRKGILRALHAAQGRSRHTTAPTQSQHSPQATRPSQAGQPAEPTRPPQAGRPAEPTRPPQAGQPAEPIHPQH
jgi:hypothetical protein